MLLIIVFYALKIFSDYDSPRLFQFIFKMLKCEPIIRIQPFLIHSVILALFASIIGPFGGFFASGFKRAFKIKVCFKIIRTSKKH